MLNIGDGVKIIKYGELVWMAQGCTSCGGNAEWKDHQPDLVGQQGVITNITMAQGEPRYSLSGVPSKKEFYNEEQLLKV